MDKKIIFDYDNPIMHDAFLMTINHEMTHKEKNHHSLLFKFKRICYSLYNFKNDRKFLIGLMKFMLTLEESIKHLMEIGIKLFL